MLTPIKIKLDTSKIQYRAKNQVMSQVRSSDYWLVRDRVSWPVNVQIDAQVYDLIWNQIMELK